MESRDNGEFDPDRFLDRHDARDRFARLLRLEDSRRLLAIRASGGAGKSDLLRRFEWSCQDPEEHGSTMPVSRVPLDQVKNGRVVDLVYQIRTDLQALDWSSFDAVRRRWLSFDVNLLDENYGQTLIDNRGAEIKGSARVIGMNVEHAMNVYMNDRGWPSKYYEDAVDEVYVRAFCADLRWNAERRPVVLLFDSYDNDAPGDLKEWVRTLLESHCLDLERRPAQLVIVLAGRDLPPLKARLGYRFEGLVEMIDAFEDWTDELVARFLGQIGFPDAQPGEIAMWRDRINTGFPLQNVRPVMLWLRAKLDEMR